VGNCLLLCDCKGMVSTPGSQSDKSLPALKTKLCRRDPDGDCGSYVGVSQNFVVGRVNTRITF
jgi:hypothetical protein